MRYYTTRAFPTASRQYEAGDAIDPANITAAEWIKGTESGAVVPARWYGTAAELAARGIPGPGVSVYETDTKIARVGDGVTSVASLPQVGSATYVQQGQIASFSATGTFIPTVTGYYLVTLLGAGASGGGGGSPSSNIAQLGGVGGAAGMFSEQVVQLVAGVSYTATIGAINASRPAGAAAGGNPGGAPRPGGASSFSGPGIPTLYADGGGAGGTTAASSTTPVAIAVWGAGITGHVLPGDENAPGCGGQVNTARGFGTIPTPYAVGGTGGAPANTTSGFGGIGGDVATAWGHGVAAVTATTGTVNGGQGNDATVPGCGGGGGGGGAATGAGGAGGLGAPGMITVRLVG